MKNYGNLTIDEIDKLIGENNEKLEEIWNSDDGSSWENYKKKCQPYWDENTELYSIKTLKMDRNDIEMRPLGELDKECLVDIETFTEWCKTGYVINDDGSGKYATESEVSDLYVNTDDFRCGKIRNDFTHICWYNR